MASEKLQQSVAEYENYIATNGYDDAVIDYMTIAAQVAFSERDRDYGLMLTGRLKQLIGDEIRKETEGADVWWLQKQAYKQGAEYVILSRFNDVLKVEAQNRVLDSYFRFLEHKRNPRDQFYMPKRKQLMRMGLIQSLQDMLDDKLDILCFSLAPGTGKAQPLYSKVLTPNGFKRMGDIKVGDVVVSGDGNPSTVIGVYPQGVKPIYELTFDDGSKCRCSDEHLWKVQTRQDRNKGDEHRVVTLKSMLKNVLVEDGKRRNYSIDYVDPHRLFDNKLLPLHPYVLGVILGDGGLSGGDVRVSTPDAEVIGRTVARLPKGYYFKHVANYDYRIAGHKPRKDGGFTSEVRTALVELGLYGKTSDKKFIPQEYLYSSYAQRLELLRGLFDTDAHADRTCVEYTTSSEQLSKDVVELVRSLGGYASVTKRKAGYKNSGGKYIECKDSYRVLVQFTSAADSPFWLSRKADAYKPKRPMMRRFVEKIEYVCDEECQCIMIDDPCHLYITDDYIITHNTTLSKFFLSGVIGWYPKDYNLFFSHSGDIARMYYDGEFDILSNSQEYAWNEIFPNLSITSTNAKMQQLNVSKYKPFPSLQCTSRGSNNAGVVRASKFLMVDDLVAGIEEALNKTFLDKLWNIYTVDARQRKIDGCKEIHIATRWSVHDVIGRIHDMYPDNDRVRFISVPDVDPETGESNFDYEYNGFSKEFFHDQALLMDDISYRCLYKQEPIEREGLLYHEDELRRYITLPEREPDAIWGICDVKNSGTDYMFLPAVAQYGDDYYCIDCICDDNADFGLQETRCADLIIRTKMQQCQFESNNGGDRFAANVAAKVAEGKGACNITTKFTEANKSTKIIVNADWVKKHVLFPDKCLYEPKSDLDKMMTFLLTYTVVGAQKKKTDDVPDGWAQFALYVNNGLMRNRVEVVHNPFGGGYYGDY